MTSLLANITAANKKPAAKKANGKTKTAAAKKAAPAVKAKPIFKKPAAKKEKPMTEPAPAPVFSLDALIAEFHSSDVRDDDFMRALLTKAFDAGKSAPRARAPRAGGPSKSEQAAELLLRPDGATTKDILELTKWPSVSVPAVARANGLTLRQEKAGRVTTYFGTRA